MITIRLSQTNKMPCASFSLPADKACPMGSKLRHTPGSVCSDCYACKGNYRFPNVRQPREANLSSVIKALSSPQAGKAWVSAMVEAIAKTGLGYFRFHDSGDIISKGYLKLIVEVCRALPSVSFWIPSKEIATVREYAKRNPLPDNLTIRLSAYMVGRTIESQAFPTSSVNAGVGFLCPAPKTHGQCGKCRACWNRSVLNVDYTKH